jgi:hypothetical protein
LPSGSTEEVQTKAGPVPVVLYLGLAPAADTRLHAEAFIDLRLAQIRLPELLSGVVVDKCRQEILLDFVGATAERDAVRAVGSVEARFYTCRKEGSSEEERGRRLFTQQVDAVAVATALVRENCIVIRLVDLELDPKGILGGLASLLGLTERVRASILERSATVFAENPICPALPAELSSLDLRFTSGGPREIAAGGLGAALAGSVDTSAATLVSLLAVMKERGVLEEAP